MSTVLNHAHSRRQRLCVYLVQNVQITWPEFDALELPSAQYTILINHAKSNQLLWVILTSWDSFKRWGTGDLVAQVWLLEMIVAKKSVAAPRIQFSDLGEERWLYITYRKENFGHN